MRLLDIVRVLGVVEVDVDVEKWCGLMLLVIT